MTREKALTKNRKINDDNERRRRTHILVNPKDDKEYYMPITQELGKLI